MSNQSSNVKTQLDIVGGYLRSPGRLYTGTAIKRYIKANIFGQKTDFHSRSIDSGRWSAYCHFNLVSSVANLLTKNHIQAGNKVLVHPLTPPKVVEHLINQNLNLVTLDIDKSTLAWEPASLMALVEESKPDLVINYSDTGLVNNLIQLIPYLETQTVPILTILDSSGLNSSVFEYIQKLGIGSVVLNHGPEFWSRELENLSGITGIKSDTWYLSWHNENRTRSILEYSLNDSHQVYQPILEALEYILLDRASKGDWKITAMQAGKKLVQAGTALEWKELFATKFRSVREAKDQIVRELPKTLSAAVPDIVFDLDLITNRKPANLSNNSHQYQITAKSWQEYFLSQLNTRPSGSLEIPTFYLNQGYLQYFVFTTEPEFWLNALVGKKYTLNRGKPIHPFFASNKTLVNTHFVSKYFFGIELGAR